MDEGYIGLNYIMVSILLVYMVIYNYIGIGIGLAFYYTAEVLFWAKKWAEVSLLSALCEVI